VSPPGETTVAVTVRETNLQTDREAPTVDLWDAYIAQSDVPPNPSGLDCTDATAFCYAALEYAPAPFGDSPIPASGSVTGTYYIIEIDQTLPVTEFWISNLEWGEVSGPFPNTASFVQLPPPR